MFLFRHSVLERSDDGLSLTEYLLPDLILKGNTPLLFFIIVNDHAVSTQAFLSAILVGAKLSISLLELWPEVLVKSMSPRVQNV